jgi:hypothetical protein
MRKYTIEQVQDICKRNNWITTDCVDEPKLGLITIQVAEDEDGIYFGEFRNTDKDKDNYFFNFYVA